MNMDKLVEESKAWLSCIQRIQEQRNAAAEALKAGDTDAYDKHFAAVIEIEREYVSLKAKAI